MTELAFDGLPMGISPQAALFNRLGDLFGLRDLEPELQARIMAEFVAAGEDASWETIPQSLRDLIEETEEAFPPIDYEDPADDPELQIDVDDDEPDTARQIITRTRR